MPLLGAIIKKLIEAKDHLPFIDDVYPIKEQEKMLKVLLSEAADTKFGRHYDFRQILHAGNPQKTFAEAMTPI